MLKKGDKVKAYTKSCLSYYIEGIHDTVGIIMHMGRETCSVIFPDCDESKELNRSIIKPSVFQYCFSNKDLIPYKEFDTLDNIFNDIIGEL